MTRQKSLPATYVIIAVNVITSLAGFASPYVFGMGLLHVGAIMDGQIWRLLTSGFLHLNFTHLLFNMFTLFFFGPALESDRFLGRRGFLILYFVSLLVGSGYAVWANLGDVNYAAVGASGAVSGVMIGVSLFAPFMMILIFGIIPIPAILYAVGFIGFSTFAIRSGSFWGVGHGGHPAGALAGLVVVAVMRPDVFFELWRQVKARFARR